MIKVSIAQQPNDDVGAGIHNDIERAARAISYRVLEDHRVPEIEAKINESMFAGGKRIRPLLCLYFGRILRVDEHALAPYARAAELVHAATLIHDDIVDNATTRRGISSLPAQVGNARAVLAGDLLLSRVMVELAHLGNLRAIATLAEVIENLARGEWMQLNARGSVEVSREHLEMVFKMKTGGLLGWACSVPAMVRADKAVEDSHSASLIRSCTSFGELFGIGFQLLDDVLDFQPESGKPFAKDLTEGLLNAVSLEMIQKFPHHREPISRLLNGDRSIEHPWTALELEYAVGQARARARSFLQQCLGLLDTAIRSVAVRNRTLPELNSLIDLVSQAHERTM